MNKIQTDIDTSKKSRATTLITIGKDLVALLRDALLVIIAILLICFPVKLNEILNNAGFIEGDIAGFKWKAGIVKSSEALNEAQATINELKVQLDSTTKILANVQNQIKDPILKAKVAYVEDENIKLKNAASKTQASVRGTISSNETLLEKAQETLNEGKTWGVVFGGDATLKAAQYEANVIAPKLGLPKPLIFYRQGSYRSVSIADDRQQAEQILIKAKKRRPDAYIVAMETWCPDFNKKNGSESFCNVK